MDQRALGIDFHLLVIPRWIQIFSSLILDTSLIIALQNTLTTTIVVTRQQRWPISPLPACCRQPKSCRHKKVEFVRNFSFFFPDQQNASRQSESWYCSQGKNFPKLINFVFSMKKKLLWRNWIFPWFFFFIELNIGQNVHCVSRVKYSVLKSSAGRQRTIKSRRLYFFVPFPILCLIPKSMTQRNCCGHL